MSLVTVTSVLPLVFEIADQVRDRARGDGIEPRRRLVVENNFGLDDQGARDAQTFLHPAGNFVGKKLLLSGEAHGLRNCAARSRAGSPIIPLRSFSGKSRFSSHGEGIEERVFLKEHADVPALNSILPSSGKAGPR